MRNKIKSTGVAAYKAMQGELLTVIKKKASSKSSIQKNPKISHRLSEACNREDEVDGLIRERASFISSAKAADCPLCHGIGVHNSGECPICRGVGTVDDGLRDEIHLSPYEQDECPLCEGSGDHNNWECPICRGVGTVDAGFRDEIDLSPYEQDECPLCNGSGSKQPGIPSLR